MIATERVLTMGRVSMLYASTSPCGNGLVLDVISTPGDPEPRHVVSLRQEGAAFGTGFRHFLSPDELRALSRVFGEMADAAAQVAVDEPA